jgi:polyisoprenoid-binding protein YceI
MSNWVFEPGHTAAEFCARHMMVTWVRGSFKNVDGKLRFDPTNVADSSAEVEINAASLSGRAMKPGTGTCGTRTSWT